MSLLAGIMFPAEASTSLVYEKKFGSSGTGTGEFNGPRGIFVGSSEIYVVDSGNRRIQKFSKAGTYLGYLSTGSTDYPSGAIGWNPGGFGMVGTVASLPGPTDQPAKKEIKKFNALLGDEGVWADSSSVTYPYTGAFAMYGGGNGTLYSVGAGNTLMVHDRDGTLLKQFTYSGSPANSRWVNCAVGPTGNVYVVDQGSKEIIVFEPTALAGASGPLTSGVSRKTPITSADAVLLGIAVDAEENIFVTDVTNHRISVIYANGIVFTDLGSAGTGNGQFSSPSALAFGDDGRLYVVDTGNNRVQVLAPYVAPPLYLTGSALSPTSIRWTWTDSSSGEGGFAVGTLSAGVLMPLATTTANASSLLEVSGASDPLLPNTRYGRYVGALNTLTNEYSFNSLFGVSIYTHADIPTNLALSGRSSFRLTLGWSGNGTRYALYRETLGAPTQLTVLVRSWSDSLTGTLYADDGLDPATTYQYRIAAYNGDQSLGAASVTLTASTGPPTPGVPTAGLAFTKQTSLTFSWAAASTSSVTLTLYQVMVGTTLSGSDFLNMTLTAATTVRLTTGLEDGKSYYAQVRGFDGQSQASDWVSASSGVGVDFTAPSAPTLFVLSHPSSDIAYAQTSLVVTVAGVTDFSGIASYSYFLDGSQSATPLVISLFSTSATAVTLALDGDGAYKLSVSAIDGAGNSSTTTLFTLKVKTAVASASDNALVVGEGSGLFIPQGALTADTRVTASLPSEMPTALFQSSQVRVSRKALNITLTNGVTQLQKAVTITLAYTAEDVAGLTESKLTMAYFDEAKSAWIPLADSRVFPDQNTVVATTTHFSVFGLIEITPGTQALMQAYNFPNPFIPSQGTTIRYVLGEAANAVSLKIYRLTGQLVRELSGTATLDINDVVWDGRDRNGQLVASEVLLTVVEVTKTSGEKVRTTVKMMGWN